MTLSTKTLLIMGAVLGSLMLSLFCLTASDLRASFLRLEEQSVVRDAQRARDALLNAVDVIHQKSSDWAVWDDAYAFVAKPTPEFIKANCGDESLANLNLNVLAFFDNDSEMVYGKMVHLGAGQESDVLQSLRSALRGAGRSDQADKARTISGLLRLPTGVMMISARPILQSSGEGPPQGTLVFGTILDEAIIKHLCAVTHQKVAFERIGDGGRAAAVDQEVPAAGIPSVQIVDSELITGTFLLNDIDSSPILMGRIAVGREIYAQGLSSLRTFGVSLAMLGICAGISASLLLNRLVLRRLSRLRDGVRTITVSGDLATRFDASGSDEISDLCRDVNTMVGGLQTAQHDLVVTTEAAEAASRAKSEFLANMSHEIRTPMTAILGFADLLLDPGQPSGHRVDCIQTIRRSGQHLLTIINDILDFSKIEAGRMTVERIETDTCGIIADVASIMRGRALEKGLDFNVEYVGRIPRFIRSDPTRLRQILLNLVGNAVKFTERGQVKIRVRMSADAPDSPLLFEIQDTGVGLTGEQQRQLFLAFSQADSSHTRRFGGTGLGLIISLRLAQMLGGDISLSSAAGKGTTFTVRVDPGPLEGISMVDSPAEIGRPPGPVNLQPEVPVSLSGVRVLLAEDGADNQRLIRFHLVKAGAEVVIAANGREAVDAVSAAVQAGALFGVVLMDMQMPEVDGYSATAMLRAAGHQVPVVALTAHAMPGDRERCITAGCDDYCAKPIDKAKLLTMVRHWADRSSRVSGIPAA